MFVFCPAKLRRRFRPAGAVGADATGSMVTSAHWRARKYSRGAQHRVDRREHGAEIVGRHQNDIFKSRTGAGPISGESTSSQLGSEFA